MRLPDSRNDSRVPDQLFIQYCVTRVNQERSSAEFNELASRCHDNNILFADASNDLRTDLLIASAENVPLTAYYADDNFGRPIHGELEKFLLRSVRCE